MIAKSASG